MSGSANIKKAQPTAFGRKSLSKVNPSQAWGFDGMLNGKNGSEISDLTLNEDAKKIDRPDLAFLFNSRSISKEQQVYNR